MKKLLFLLMILGVFSSCTSNKEDAELTAQVDSLAKYSSSLSLYHDYQLRSNVFEQIRSKCDLRAASDSLPVAVKLEYIRLGQEMTDSLNLYDHLANKLVSSED